MYDEKSKNEGGYHFRKPYLQEVLEVSKVVFKWREFVFLKSQCNRLLYMEPYSGAKTVWDPILSLLKKFPFFLAKKTNCESRKNNSLFCLMT